MAHSTRPFDLTRIPSTCRAQAQRQRPREEQSYPSCALLRQAAPYPTFVSTVSACSAPSGLSSCLNIRYRSRPVASNSFDRVTSPATSFAVYWGLDKCTYSSDETVVLGMTADPEIGRAH